MQLTEHVSLHEVTRSQAAERLAIDNAIPVAFLDRMTAVCREVFEPVRRHFGVPGHISSGYRCPALNAVVGGSPDSRHMSGEALDFELPGVPNVVVARWIDAHVPIFDELILEYWSPTDPAAGWVHVAYRLAPRTNRRAIMVYTRNLEGRLIRLSGLPPG